MGRSTLELSATAAVHMLATIGTAVRVTGSEKSMSDGTILLVIEGDCVPECQLCRCTVTRLVSADETSLHLKFSDACDPAIHGTPY
jgi:hypothetical protein